MLLTDCPDTRILCEISSDLSAADEKKFIEKNKHFWSLQKHYLRIEYTVRVLIGPADIRFELWFNDQKLSRDESIRVQWIPTQPPKGTLEYGTPVVKSIPEPVELSNVPPTPINTTPSNRPWMSNDTNGKAERNGFAIVSQQPIAEGDDKKKNRMGGLLARARGGRWTKR